MSLPKKVLLVDGSSLAFRMYFALERMGFTAPDGRPSWAIFGFFKALLEVIIKEQPTVIITAFDAKGPTFREQKFEYYKANRPTEMPEALAAQWPEIQRGLRLIGMEMLELRGIEADDIIGTLSVQAVAAGWEVATLSGDRDIFQLVNEHVVALYPSNTGVNRYDANGVMEKMGVRPDQIIHYKALAGDSSDNIPGVSGVGDKTACQLLSEYDTLNNIYQHLDDLKPGLKLKLELGRQSALDSQYLATIKLDCDQIKFNFDKLDHRPEPDAIGLTQYIQEYRLTTLQKMLPGVLQALGSKALEWDTIESSPIVPDPVSNLKSKFVFQTLVVASLDDLESALAMLPSKSTLGCNLKLGSAGQVKSIALSWQGKQNHSWQVIFIPIGNPVFGLELTQVLQLLDKILQSHTGNIFSYDTKNQQKVFQNLGFSLPAKTLDVLLAGYLENSIQQLGLAELSLEKLNYSLVTTPQAAIGLGFEEPDDYSQTGVEAALVAALGEYYRQLPPRLLEIWETMESPLAFVLAQMELDGVYLDQPQLRLITAELTKYITRYEQEILADLGHPDININSTQQLGVALAAKGFKLGKTTGGAPSTDRNTLEKLALTDESGLITKIIEYRTLHKLRSTYTENLVALIDLKDGRLHAEFNQTVAATGRLSSSNPNLQNIPIKNAQYGKLIRSCFAAESGNCLIAADYSQIELRFLAHFSQDPVLLETFRENQDVHARTAAEIFEIPLDQVTGSQRRMGKTLNFALVYQQGAYATARMLGISNKEGTQFIQKYFEKLPRVKPFVEEVLEKARKDGFVETFWGRRRYFTNLNSGQAMLRKIDERAAFNAVLQGSNADLIKLAMLRLKQNLAEKGIKARLILQVHDELVLEVPTSQATAATAVLTTEMALDQPLVVPILVEAGTGQNWSECKG